MARVGGFIKGRLVEADGESFDVLGAALVRERGQDHAGIDAAANERADRHVADEPASNRLRQERAQFLDQSAFAASGDEFVGLDGETPISGRGATAELGPGRAPGEWPAGSFALPS